MINTNIQNIFKTYGPQYIKTYKLSKEQWKVYNSIINCKTSHLGMHTVICDKCGHELIRRKDDNVDTIKSRIKTYIDVTSPLIEYYEKKEKLYTAEVSERINRLGSDVAKDVIELLKK